MEQDLLKRETQYTTSKLMDVVKKPYTRRKKKGKLKKKNIVT